MRELLFAQSRLGEYDYEYYLLISSGGIQFAGESFGVKIVDPNGEKAVVPGITTSYDAAVQALQSLVRNQVTPTTLRDVLDDWLAQGVL